jgi:putative heme transporter
METLLARHLSAAPFSRTAPPWPPTAGRGAQTKRRSHRARVAVIAAATAVLAAAGVTKRSALAASVAALGHLQWSWIPAAVTLELASLAALAGMQLRLLVAGRARVGVRPMLATTFAANAVSVSVPVAGPELGTLFTFRRLIRQGADATLASWSLLAGGLVSTATGALVVAGGGLSSGNIVALAAAAPVALLAVAALAVVAVAAHRPRLRRALEQSAAWALHLRGRVLRRRTDDPGQAARAWADRLGSLHLPPWGWVLVTGLALANWLTDATVLAVSIHAAGAPVPWHVLLLIYGSGVAAQGLTVTPGGLGVAEGTLGLTLVAAGLRPGPALAAVLLYRLVSFWLVACAGWLVFLRLRRRHLPEECATSRPVPATRPVPGGCRDGAPS